MHASSCISRVVAFWWCYLSFLFQQSWILEVDSDGDTDPCLQLPLKHIPVETKLPPVQECSKSVRCVDNYYCILPIMDIFFESNVSFDKLDTFSNFSRNGFSWSDQQKIRTLTSDIDHSAIIGVLVTIVSMAIIGNSLVIYIIISDRKLHRTPFYFVICISVSDLCRATFCIPFLLSTVSHDFKWIYGDTTCLILAFANSFCIYSSSMGLLTIAIDRHLSLTYPRFYKKCTQGSVNIGCILLAWGVAICLSFPPVVEHGAYVFIKQEMQCTLHHLPYRENTTLGYMISLVCIQLTTLFLYTRLFSFLRSHRRMAPLYHAPARSNNWTFFGPGANGQALINLLNGFTGRGMNHFTAAVRNVPQAFGRVVNLRVIKNEHLTRLFFVSSAIYSVLWIPYLFYIFMHIFRDSFPFSFKYVTVSTILCHTHVAACPFIYLLFGSPLKSSIFGRFKSWHQRRQYGVVRQKTSEHPQPTVQCIDLEV